MTDPESIDKYCFYNAVLIVLEVVRNFAIRYSVLAQDLAEKELNQERVLMVQMMLKNGMSVSQIAKCVSKSEEEIMYLLWDLDEPLTSSEIVKKAVNKTWKKSYINLLINSLLKKDMIKVVGVKQMTKNYARTFVPTMTKDAYAIKQISDRPNFADSDIPTLFSELIERTESSDVFDELEALLKKRREELGK